MKISRRDVLLPSRFTAAEADAIRRAADFHGVSVSAYIRRHVLAAATVPQMRPSSSMQAVASYR